MTQRLMTLNFIIILCRDLNAQKYTAFHILQSRLDENPRAWNIEKNIVMFEIDYLPIQKFTSIQPRLYRALHPLFNTSTQFYLPVLRDMRKNIRHFTFFNENA